MSLIGTISKLAREYVGHVLTDGTNVLGTAANPIVVSASSSTISDGSVTTAKLAAGAVTTAKLGAGAVTGPTMANPVRKFVGVGHNNAGAATATGFKVGDIVLWALNISDDTDGSASFEATITVNDQIQQSSASDLSAKKFFFVVLAQS